MGVIGKVRLICDGILSRYYGVIECFGVMLCVFCDCNECKVMMFSCDWKSEVYMRWMMVEVFYKKI